MSVFNPKSNKQHRYYNEFIENIHLQFIGPPAAIYTTMRYNAGALICLLRKFEVMDLKQSNTLGVKSRLLRYLLTAGDI